MAHLLSKRSRSDPFGSPALGKCLQMLTADLGRGLYAIAQLTHDSGERVERSAPRLAREMRAAQVVANPM